MKTIYVVGAGISGCAVARKLAEAGFKVEVFESRDIIGGNCSDYKDENGIMIHRYGPHIFHTNSEEANGFMSKFANSKHNYVHKVVNEDGICIPYNLSNIKDGKLRCLITQYFGSYDSIPIYELISHWDERITRLGKKIYEKCYMVYSSKQWGDYANYEALKRVKVRLNGDDRYFIDKYQWIPDSYSTLLYKVLCHENISIHLGYKFNFDSCPKDAYVIYTGKLDELFDYKLGKLSYITTDIIFRHYEKDNFQSHAVINYTHSANFTRITEYKKFMSDSSNCEGTTVSYEYPREADDEDVPMYVVNDGYNNRLYDMYVNELKNHSDHFWLLGRLAEYKYYDMDKALLRAFEVASEVIKKVGIE